MAWNEIKRQFGCTLITGGRSRCCCDYDRGIYIYCLVGICIGDTAIFLQSTQFIHKAVAKHCNCESFKCVFLQPHRARSQGMEPHPFGRLLCIRPWWSLLRWFLESFPTTTLEPACHKQRGRLVLVSKCRRGPDRPPEWESTNAERKDKGLHQPFQHSGKEKFQRLFNFLGLCPRVTRDWKYLH